MAGIASEPAYPAPEASHAHFGAPTAYMGLTKREHFAGLAMQGELSCQSDDHQIVNEASIDWLAARSVRIADAMLIALAGETRASRIEKALRLVVAEFERLGIPEGAESEMLRECRKALE